MSEATPPKLTLERWAALLNACCKIAAMAGAVYLATHDHPGMAAWFLVLAYCV